VAATPYQSALAYLGVRPKRKWAAFCCSVVATLVLILFGPLIYLVTDLVACQGIMPAYDSLPTATRQQFRIEWNSGLGTDAEVIDKTITFSDSSAETDEAVWRPRFEAAEFVAIARLVSPAAAEHMRADRASSGMLATVVANRGHWSAPFLGRLARWNPWMWTNEGYLTWLFLTGVVILFARGIFNYMAGRFAISTSVEANTRLRRALYSHSLRLAALAVNEEARTEAAEVLTRRTEQLQEAFVVRQTIGVRAPLLAVLAFCGVLLIHFWLGLTMLLLCGAGWLLIGQWAAWSRRDARQATRRGEVRMAVLRENMTLMRMIKAYLMERFNQTRVERHLRELAKAAERRLRGELLTRPMLYAATALIGLALFYVTARVVVGGGCSLAALVFQVSALAALAVALHEWIVSHSRIERARVAAAIVFEFLNRRAAAQPIDAEFLQPLAKKLELVDVSYREIGTGHMTLDGVSISVIPGQRIAIVCSTPIEARTFAYLLTRFVDPTGGEIRMDGKNTRWVTYESLRTQVAMVMQDGLTFSDTVANNIGCGDSSFSLPQIIEAAKLAHAHQFVQRMPYGYETPLGGGGHSLRPGELFRIALARAFLRDPSVLIIEEPAEPYDADSVALIDDALHRYQPGRTLFILARRSSTVKSADKVFVIQGGKIVATGNHDHTPPDGAKTPVHKHA